MSLATIDLKPGFVDRKLISDQPAAGALAKISNSTPIDLIGTQMQTIDFTGEMGIFGEGATGAVAAEQKKSSNDATNGVVTINPITFYISYRFPKKFLQLFGVNGAYNPTDATFRAGSPQTMLQSIVAQPYQAGILDQYRTYVNRAISRALDFAAIFGVNPATKAASTVARTNGYVLEHAGDIGYTPGTGAQAATAFKSVELALTRHIVNQGGKQDITYDGLAVRYGGAHGFGGGKTRRITIRNCDLCWIGGGLQFFKPDGRPVRFGNAIEFWNINKIRLFTVIDDLVLRLFQGSLHVFRKHVKFCIRLSKDMNYAIPWRSLLR